MAEWISVEERLPESGKSVLGLMANKFPFVAAYRECDETWYMPTQTGCSKCKKVVTHWMPLPEPPKEKDND